MNLVEVPITDGGVKFGNSVVPVGREALSAAADTGDRTVTVGVRPEHFDVAAAARPPRRDAASRSPSTSSRSSAPTATSTAPPTSAATHQGPGGPRRRPRGPGEGLDGCTSCRARRDPRVLHLHRRAPHRLSRRTSPLPGPRRRGRPARQARARRTICPTHGATWSASASRGTGDVNELPRSRAHRFHSRRVTKCRQIITQRYPHRGVTHQPAVSAEPSPSSCPSSWSCPGPSRSPGPWVAINLRTPQVLTASVNHGTSARKPTPRRSRCAPSS